MASAKVAGLATPLRRLVPGNPVLGKQIYHGRFRHAGFEATGHAAAIFSAAPSDRPWIEALHGFGWLAHVEATGLELGRAQARALISDWLNGTSRHPAAAKELGVLCSRVTSWIFAAPFLLDNADEKFRQHFYSGLSRQIRDLHWSTALARSCEIRLDCAAALALAAVALKGFEPLRSAALAFLADMLGRRILPDGGHVSGNPAELVRLLLVLLPLQRACNEARLELPAPLQSAVDRMLPMVRFFLHADSGLAIFHGASDPLVAECTAILEADATGGRPLAHAFYSGYARLEHGGSVVICDTGVPLARTGRRAISPLAFEFSDAGCRIVMNCGTPASGNPRLMAVACLAEAHSTALLAPAVRTRSTWHRILANIGLAFPPVFTSAAELGSSHIGSMVEAHHDVYRHDTGYLHQRRLFLSAVGNDFRGEDSFFAADGHPSPAEASFAIRFHLHPSVKATRSKGGGIVLLLPNRSGWKFSTRGADVSLEDSVCLWGRAGPRKTTQIVLGGRVAAPVNWAFKRIEGLAPTGDEAGYETNLLL
jgi:uncharacterized heparinase superfamily protein